MLAGPAGQTGNPTGFVCAWGGLGPELALLVSRATLPAVTSPPGSQAWHTKGYVTDSSIFRINIEWQKQGETRAAAWLSTATQAGKIPKTHHTTALSAAVTVTRQRCVA